MGLIEGLLAGKFVLKMAASGLFSVVALVTMALLQVPTPTTTSQWVAFAATLALFLPLMMKLIDVTWEAWKRRRDKKGQEQQHHTDASVEMARLGDARQSAEWARIDAATERREQWVAQLVRGYHNYAKKAGLRAHLMNGEVFRLQAVLTRVLEYMAQNDCPIPPGFAEKIYNEELTRKLEDVDLLPPPPLEEVRADIRRRTRNGEIEEDTGELPRTLPPDAGAM